jgi:hypothetical protein
MTEPADNISVNFSIRIDDIMFDCGDARKLADFYASLLGWNSKKLGEGCFSVCAPGQPIRFLCQQESDYVPPVWPEEPGKQQKMIHMDFTVGSLPDAVRRAVSLGAAAAQKQYNPEQWRTMLDPAGHPFCLCLAE